MKNRKAEPGLRLINMEDVAVEQVEWLLYPFIPYGKVTIIQGDPGEGKTTMVLQIIAKLTKGEPVLPVMDGEEEPTENTGEPVNVIYQTAEDGLGDTIKTRLLAAGADRHCGQGGVPVGLGHPAAGFRDRGGAVLGEAGRVGEEKA